MHGRLFIESPVQNNILNKPNVSRMNTLGNPQMIVNFITVRVYLNINEDNNNDLFKKLYLHHKTNPNISSPNSEQFLEHPVKFEHDTLIYIDVSI